MDEGKEIKIVDGSVKKSADSARKLKLKASNLEDELAATTMTLKNLT